MAEKMVASKYFPKIMIDSDIAPGVELFFQKLVQSPDSDVQAYVRDMQKLPPYQILDGSKGSSCNAGHNAKDRTITLAPKLVGSYIDDTNHIKKMAQGNAADAVIAAQAAHEIGHALQHYVPLGESRFDAAVKGRLDQLQMESAGNIKAMGASMSPMNAIQTGSSEDQKFSHRVEAEIRAVEIENGVLERLNLRSSPRSNVTDGNNINFSIADMNAWYREKYELSGACTNGSKLGIEKSDSDVIKMAQSAQSKIDLVLSANPDSMPSYLAAKKQIEGQVIDMPEKAKAFVIAEFNLKAAETLIPQRGQEMV